MKRIDLTTAANENYAPGLLVLVSSVLISLNPKASVKIHLFNGGLSCQTMKILDRICRTLHPHCSLTSIPFDESVFTGVTLGPGNSYMTYARLLLGSMLDLEKVIYLDSDILVFKDLDEAWELDMQRKIALVCKDDSIPTISYDCPWPLDETDKETPYFNGGFMVIDLNQWRRKSIESASLKLARISVCKFWDQTILNYVLRNDVAFINNQWNWQSDSNPDTDHAPLPNYHFVEKQKPWLHYGDGLKSKLWRLYYSNFIRRNLVIYLLLRKDYRKALAWVKDQLVQDSMGCRFLYACYLQVVHGSSIPKFGPSSILEEEFIRKTREKIRLKAN
jgi:lipopolysaccharide biosynthesis glycosyltransferase